MVVLERELADITPQSSADAIPASLRRGGASPRQVVVMILIGMMMLAFFGSRDLYSWADRLGDGPLAKETRSFADRWDRAMVALGFVLPHNTLRLTIGRILDCHWPSGSPAMSNE